jgi:hypothetical protein
MTKLLAGNRYKYFGWNWNSWSMKGIWWYKFSSDFEEFGLLPAVKKITGNFLVEKINSRYGFLSVKK